MPEKARHLLVGEAAEKRACRYLQDKGLRLVDRNLRTPHGEIDLIMMDHDTVVFVEVRYRKSGRYGLAEETVTQGKQQKLVRSAQWFLQRNNEHAGRPCRFDLVAITGDNQAGDPNWITNAFF
ncbi:MAG: YraN family protein [Gammaproteobacteria bacterium]|nr:YraN family protein [Gammaproteobacteria bacterium]